MRRAGMGQRTVLWLEPSRGFAAVVYGVLAMALLGVLGALTLDPRGSVSRTLARVGPLPDLVHNSLALAVALGLMCLLAMTAVVDGRRWRTTRAVKRLAEDPALAGLLPPDEADERRPVAPHRPDLRVEFVGKPWFGGQPRPLHRVEEHRNVVGRRPLSILYLRVFENQPRARTFVKGAWREFGYVHLLRSATAVDPATFRKAREGGRLPALFIASDDRLNAALAGAPTAPMPRGWHRERTIAGSTVLVRDRYAAYPVRSLICHGTYWKRAIALLLARSDLVVLDLSGYLPRNDGTRYELQRLVDTVPFERVVLVADPRSGKRFLRAELTRAWDNMAAGSPNAGVGLATVEIAIIDYYRRFERQTSSGTTEQTRLELHARRSETRWLLARVSSRLEHARAVSPDVPPPSRPRGPARRPSRPAITTPTVTTPAVTTPPPPGLTTRPRHARTCRSAGDGGARRHRSGGRSPHPVRSSPDQPVRTLGRHGHRQAR